MAIAQMTEGDMLGLAKTAVEQIDTRGRRGTERVTHDQIEALALLVVLSGIIPASQQLASEALATLKTRKDTQL
jgi:hypothetical protein